MILEVDVKPGGWIKTTIPVDNDLKIYDFLIQIYCVLENQVLPFSERSLLTYYVKWGINKETEKLYMDGYNRSKQITANLKNALAKKGFIIKNENMNSWELPLFLKKKRDSLTLILDFNVTE